MIYEKINISKEYPMLEKGKNDVILDVICREKMSDIGNKKYPALLICPGGGYAWVSPREADPIALAFVAKGIQCFILHYNVYPSVVYPTQLLEAAAAVDYIRNNAEKYSVMPDQISVIGFSAGGHLAGNYGIEWHKDFVCEKLKTEKENLRPNGLVLCYGVLSAVENVHEESIAHLLGERVDDYELRERVSFEKNVIKGLTPPSFIWHTQEDQLVPVQNSIQAAQALIAEKIPVELHIYTQGWHGLATADALTLEEEAIQRGTVLPEAPKNWIDQCAKFLFRLAGKKIL